jgi:prepilin-type N-terminal cleavage/methylation domain-containing protein
MVRVMKIKGEKGFSLIETLVALALLGTIGVSFFNGLVTTSTARVAADEKVSSKILAEILMEDVKKQTYNISGNYTYSIPEEFPGYSANFTVENIRNDYLQKLTFVIYHRNDDTFTLESYKSRRTFN